MKKLAEYYQELHYRENFVTDTAFYVVIRATRGSSHLQGKAISSFLSHFGLTNSLKKTNILGQDISRAPNFSIGDYTLEVMEDFVYQSCVALGRDLDPLLPPKAQTLHHPPVLPRKDFGHQLPRLSQGI